ncbi:winged helix-turn-helix transcriptional regulator [Micrococcales bacterium 31B]|nr:winged helix-turn-helix transcriptional regulator [Micrococcales bacterium 31B]
MTEDLERWADALALLANPQRLKVVLALHGHPGARASDIADAEVTRNYVSRTLAACERAGLVEGDWDGQARRYRLTHEGVHRVLHELGAEHTERHAEDDHAEA